MTLISSPLLIQLPACHFLLISDGRVVCTYIHLSPFSSINPQSSVKPENWTTQTSGSSSSTSIPVASTLAPASNGPPALRPYMSSAAGTPNSGSHHATYTPCSSNSSGIYEGSTLPLTKKEMAPLTSADNGGSYLAPTNAAEVPGDLALLGVSQANDAQPPVPSSDRLQVSVFF